MPFSLVDPEAAIAVDGDADDDGDGHSPDGDASPEAVPLHVDKPDVCVGVGQVVFCAKVELGICLLSLLSGDLPDLILGPGAAGTNTGAEGDKDDEDEDELGGGGHGGKP